MMRFFRTRTENIIPTGQHILSCMLKGELIGGLDIVKESVRRAGTSSPS
uniref:Uncharacterized protein n=1 Tax=Anguilla anguilla TaxID=7936 RepID=A0A0E9TW96_ANGAN